MAVNLSPLGGVGQQFFTNNGVPLAGGTINTYLAGTTTNAATYTSSAGNIAQANPIVLNSAGRVPSGEIWLTDGITYKFVISDASGNLIGTYDNLSGINSNFLSFTNSQEIQTATAGQTVFTLTTMQYLPGTNSLSVFVDGVDQYGPSGTYAYTETSSTVVTFTSGLHVGALVKFTTTQTQNAGVTNALQIEYDPAGTDAVSTNVQAKLRQTVSVLDFGADPTGTIDSTTAIQNAITYAANNAYTLFIPDGLFLYTNLTVPSGKALSIYGSSKENAILRQTSSWNSSTSGITSTGSFNANSVCFDQYWLSASHTSPSGYNDGASATTWGGYFNIQITTTAQVSFNNCLFTNICRGALVINATSVDIFNCLSECLLSPAQTIVACSYCQQVSMNNNSLIATRWSTGTGNGNSGFYNFNTTNLEICNNTFVGHQLVARGSGGTFTGSISGTTLTVSALSTGVALYPGMSISGNNIIADNNIVSQLTGTTGSTGTYQLAFNNSTVSSETINLYLVRAIISGNIIDTPVADTAPYGWKYLVFSNNIIRMSGDMGLAIDGCQYVSVTGNVIDGTRVGGIHIGSAYSIECTGNVVKDVAQASSGPYSYIDTYGRYASSSGSLGGITIDYDGGNQQSLFLTVSGNTVSWESPPPATDNGPSPAIVAAIVKGIWVQESTNLSSQSTGAFTGNYVESAYSSIPEAFVSVMSHRFYLAASSSTTGTPITGETFTNGSNSFVYLSSYGNGALCFIKKLIGTVPTSTTFTGSISGATLVSNSLPQLTWVGITGAGNFDWTTTYANQNVGV